MHISVGTQGRDLETAPPPILFDQSLTVLQKDTLTIQVPTT